MKTAVLLLAALLCAAPSDFDSAVLTLTGAGSMEELDETTLERFRALSLHPVSLNTASRSRLLSCGLLNAFQVASLIEYRQQTGDILSYTELALVDGFPEPVADALSLFTVLESSGPPGKRSGRRIRQDVMLRGSMRSDEGSDPQAAGGLKYKLSLGERAEINWSARNTYSEPAAVPGIVSAAVYGRRYLGKLVLGHFNARFGQGLAIWSGFSMSAYGSVESLRRSVSGFSSTGSFSPQLCGAAADFDLGRWSAGAAYSVPDGLPLGYLSYTSRTFTTGIAASSEALSAHFQAGMKNTSVYGELAWKSGPQAVCGVMWVPSYGNKAGAVLRYVNGVPEAIAGVRIKGLESVTALSSRQFRIMARYSRPLQLRNSSLTPSVRLAARNNGAWRLEGRGELQLDAGGWMLRSRLDAVCCQGLSWLVNAEAARTREPLRVWLRWTLFKVEDWSGRIYVYERDVPGCFNVRAYYGKGWALSAYGAWKLSRRHAVYLRASYIAYPWNTTEKPTRTEVRLQYQLSL